MTTDRERVVYLMTLTPAAQVEFLRINGCDFKIEKKP